MLLSPIPHRRCLLRRCLPRGPWPEARRSTPDLWLRRQEEQRDRPGHDRGPAGGEARRQLERAQSTQSAALELRTEVDRAPGWSFQGAAEQGSALQASVQEGRHQRLRGTRAAEQTPEPADEDPERELGAAAALLRLPLLGAPATSCASWGRAASAPGVRLCACARGRSAKPGAEPGPEPGSELGSEYRPSRRGRPPQSR